LALGHGFSGNESDQGETGSDPKIWVRERIGLQRKRPPLSVNKSNLLRLKDKLMFAKSGLDLLNEKKEALMAHISTLSNRAEGVRASLNERLGEAYGHLRKAILTHGRLACERASHAGKAV
jgi:V/A-type H+-transporting ATPase subunit D